MEERSRLCTLHTLASGDTILMNWDLSREDKFVTRHVTILIFPRWSIYITVHYRVSYISQLPGEVGLPLTL